MRRRLPRIPVYTAIAVAFVALAVAVWLGRGRGRSPLGPSDTWTAFNCEASRVQTEAGGDALRVELGKARDHISAGLTRRVDALAPSRMRIRNDSAHVLQITVESRPVDYEKSRTWPVARVEPFEERELELRLPAGAGDISAPLLIFVGYLPEGPWIPAEGKRPGTLTGSFQLLPVIDRVHQLVRPPARTQERGGETP